MRRLILILPLLWPMAAYADYVVAAHTIRANTIVTGQDLITKKGTAAGAAEAADVIGMETRVMLYPGRPIRLSDVGIPAVVERNQIVPLIYHMGGLQISTEGRSLARAAPGEVIRVMNLSSRNTVYGRVSSTGQIIVSK